MNYLTELQKGKSFLGLQPLHNKSGFTLTEVLLVLVSWSIFILIISPIHNKVLSSIKDDQFLEQFESDLLLTQQLTMQDHGSYYLLFQKQSNDYTLYDGELNQTLFRRPLPKDWSYQMNTTRSPIRFNRNGTIRHPGTMRFYSPNRSYKVTFPFGISRATIE